MKLLSTGRPCTEQWSRDVSFATPHAAVLLEVNEKWFPQKVSRHHPLRLSLLLAATFDKPVLLILTQGLKTRHISSYLAKDWMMSIKMLLSLCGIQVYLVSPWTSECGCICMIVILGGCLLRFISMGFQNTSLCKLFKSKTNLGTQCLCAHYTKHTDSSCLQNRSQFPQNRSHRFRNENVCV